MAGIEGGEFKTSVFLPTLTDGGEPGMHPTEEAKRDMSQQ